MARGDARASRMYATKWWLRLARAATLAVSALALASLAALVPVGVHCDLHSPAVLNLHRSEALADDDKGYQFLSTISRDTGLDIGDFIATAVNALAVSSGKVITGVDNVVFGGYASRNLAALIDTADYPDYDLLSAEEQAEYGSRENYDAYKFNSLLNAFGLGTARDRFYTYGQYDLSDEQQEIVSHFGSIGQTWLNRGGVALSDVKELVTNTEYVSTWVGSNAGVVDGGNVDGWPSILPDSIKIGVGDTFKYGKESYKIYKLANKPIYWLNTVYRSSGGYYYIWTYAFSESAFSYNATFGNDVLPPTTLNSSSTQRTYGDKTYYVWSNEFGGTNIRGSNVGFDAPAYCNMPVHVLDSDDSTYQNNFFDAIYDAAPLILFGADVSTYGTYPLIDYPGQEEIDELPEDTPIYAPEQVNNQTVWNVYITQPEPEPEPGTRPENPYNPTDPDNPQYQSGTPEWNQETSENLTPALDIQFNKLFPFCIVYDLKLFWDRLKSIVGVESNGMLRAQARSQYEFVTLPAVDSAGLQDGITFDLGPVATLLRFVRPAVFWFLVVALVMSVIDFWRRILTGA